MDSKDAAADVTGAGLPQTLVDGLLRLCQGDFSFRLPRSLARDNDDMVAFFVNSIAEELERILRTGQEQERRLAGSIDQISEALIAVAAGDFSAQVDRDFSGDPSDVLAFMVNNTITELRAFVAAAQQRADEDRHRLEALVEARTAELKILATTDGLTGLLNRRRLFEIAEAERARSERYGHSLALAMLDLDHFKRINDELGHASGDDALCRVATTVRGQLRQQDHAGRYGGEEFVVVMPETTLATACEAIERTRLAVAVLEATGTERRLPIRISAGVIEVIPREPIDSALARADGALYRAKEAGRNRVVCCPERAS